MSAWLDGVTRCASTLLAGSIGAAGRLYDVRERRTLGDYAVHAHTPAARAMLIEHHGRSMQRIDFLRRGWSARDVVERTSTDTYLKDLRDRSLDAGLHDMWHITVGDGDGTWATVGFLIGESRVRALSARAIATLRQHLGIALRAQVGMARFTDSLRAKRVTEGGLAGGPPAAYGSRDAIRRAIRSLEAEPVAGSAPLDRDEALAIWWGVLEGRWQLVDEHDHAGRRYVLARQVPWGIERVPRLTRRQAQVAALAADGHSDKGIAFLLGLQRSTVASHLTEALDRLELPSRVALARAFTAGRTGLGVTVDELAPVPLILGGARRVDDATIVAFDLDPSASAEVALVEGALTEAQRPIVRLALAGLSDADIAATLGRSRHTVSNQLRRAYARLGVSTRTELCTRIGELVAGATITGPGPRNGPNARPLETDS